ncbi:pentapeptide repeat-containing protein [Streptomyces coeruleorubidus]|uniref:pentapeptide repeat-containing protein n=1 Tax=Streptomyces coeruleorubidus TaxID=116188 RepID=UPI0037A24CE6
MRADRNTYLAGLTPGADIDYRGTTFTPDLLSALLQALHDPTTAHPRIGTARFESAMFTGTVRFGPVTFTGDADFERVTFTGAALFGSATFTGAARFVWATFKRGAWFKSATFEGDAEFRRATFKAGAWFKSATFEGDAGFWSATFEDGAGFESAIFEGDASFMLATLEDADFEAVTFEGDADFNSVTFTGAAQFKAVTFTGAAQFKAVTFADASFMSATFTDAAEFSSVTFTGNAVFESVVVERAAVLGPLRCDRKVVLSAAMFKTSVTLLLAADEVECRRTRWSSTAELRLRHASVDFEGAVFEYPLTIAAAPSPFPARYGQQLDEGVLADRRDASVRLTSLRGVDAAHLVLSDIDLTRCLFAGTVHLDQIRMEGDCSFSSAPSGTHWRRRGPVRFTPRRTLAEEHHWRAGQAAAVPGWTAAEPDPGHVGPTQLAPVYRALRKSLEDSKDEPGAADFYYGEMEMRRHDRTRTTRAERDLLHGYWLLSGYGLRASRALGWLALAMISTVVLLMGFGLAQDDPRQAATGTVPPGGGKVTFEIDKADPQNPTGNGFTGERFEKALRVTLNSVVFRSSGQDLTTAGTYIEMASRLTEPVLLGLAVLAVRNRVKR